MHRYVYNPYNPICVVYVPTDPKIVFCGSSMGPSLPVTKLPNGIQRHGIVFLDLSRCFAVAPAESVPFKVYVNRSFAGISCIKKNNMGFSGCLYNGNSMGFNEIMGFSRCFSWEFVL